MLAAAGQRRYLFITLSIVLLVIITFYSQPYLDTERFTNVIPHASSKHDSKISRLHYLIPASLPNLHFCYNLVSSVVNRYPTPTVLGWHGADEFDAAITHLAKLRAMERYFNSLDPKDDDDLVLIVDGYDILLQLPPEIMIERYFEVAARADAHLADRFNTSVEDLHSRGIRQTIFWGPDKICWPIDPSAPRCWAAPKSPIPPKAWGPHDGQNPMFFSDPRWLNSGTVMAPVGDMRRYITATMMEIKETYNPDYEFRESDQFYVSNVWGRQEYWRSKMATKGGEVPGGPPDRVIPERSDEEQKTEYHIAIEYESALFQTKAGYEPYFGYMQFNGSDLSASMTVDILKQGPSFKPIEIKMPENVASALSKLYDAIPDAHPGSVASDWIRTVELGVNFVTHHIYALWHCTGPKEFVALEYPTLWFYPFVKSLLRAAVKGAQAGELISSKLIDGRQWAPKNALPGGDILQDEFGGVWTDLNGREFVAWRDLCAEHEAVLFQGEEKGVNPAEPAVKLEAPAVQPTEPELKPMEPAVEPVESAPQPAEPGLKPVEPAVQPVEPAVQPVEPAIQPIEPGLKQIEPAVKPVEEAVQPIEPAPVFTEFEERGKI